MKLLFDCTELSYFNENSGHRAGVFNVALNLFNELKKRGIDMTFSCDYRRYYFMKNLDKFSDIPLLEEHSSINRFWGWLIYKTNKFPIRLKYAILIITRFYDRYFYQTNKKNLDQLKSFDVHFAPFTPCSKEIEKSNLKRFRMIHDIIPIMNKGVSKNPKDWHYKIYNSINAKDYYVTNSESTRTDVLDYFPVIKPENIKTTLLGANENFKPSKTDETRKYIFSLCTLGKRKNLIFAIKIFFKFIERNKIKDLYLVLGGGTWKKFENELLSTIGEFDRSKIILTGYIKDEELPKWYSNALMFIYPSLYEGFGLPVLEAMQCGCPVICSNTSSLPEVIGEAGIQINPENDEELCEAYEKMYYDNFFRELCVERGLIRSKKFSWEKCASELLEFIETKLIEN